jgi:aspartyl protease family protein
MAPKTIALMMIGALVAGWVFAPSDTSDKSNESAEAVADQSQPKVKFTPQTAAAPVKTTGFSARQNQAAQGKSVALKRAADGHFYVDGDIRGVQVKFLVDTGASMVALTADDARSLGLFWSPDELRMIGRGANGDIQGKPVTIESLQIGGFKVDNIPAVIIPEGLDVSLLGQAFLSKIGNVNINKDQMTFS